MKLPRDLLRDLIRSLPARSAFWPSRLCRGFPSRFILDFALSDSRDFIVVDLLIEAYVSDEIQTENYYEHCYC